MTDMVSQRESDRGGISVGEDNRILPSIGNSNVLNHLIGHADYLSGRVILK